MIHRILFSFGVRCVVMVGLPYPNIYSPELKEKMTYLDATLGVRFFPCFEKKSSLFCFDYSCKNRCREIVLSIGQQDSEIYRQSTNKVVHIACQAVRVLLSFGQVFQSTIFREFYFSECTLLLPIDVLLYFYFPFSLKLAKRITKIFA